jgi:hypothetical protein
MRLTTLLLLLIAAISGQDNFEQARQGNRPPPQNLWMDD